MKSVFASVMLLYILFASISWPCFLYRSLNLFVFCFIYQDVLDLIIVPFVPQIFGRFLNNFSQILSKWASHKSWPIVNNYTIFWVIQPYFQYSVTFYHKVSFLSRSDYKVPWVHDNITKENVRCSLKNHTFLLWFLDVKLWEIFNPFINPIAHFS